MVEKQLIDLTEALCWLYHCWKKFYLDFLMYFLWVVHSFESIPKGLKNGFESTLMGLMTGIGSHDKGWREANWFYNGWILAHSLLQDASFGRFKVIIFGWRWALEVLSWGWRLTMEVIPDVEEWLIGSKNVRFWLPDVHKSQFWPKELTVSQKVRPWVSEDLGTMKLIWSA